VVQQDLGDHQVEVAPGAGCLGAVEVRRNRGQPCVEAAGGGQCGELEDGQLDKGEPAPDIVGAGGDEGLEFACGGGGIGLNGVQLMQAAEEITGGVGDLILAGEQGLKLAPGLGERGGGDGRAVDLGDSRTEPGRPRIAGPDKRIACVVVESVGERLPRGTQLLGSSAAGWRHVASRTV
jgi:hypothetical protein